MSMMMAESVEWYRSAPVNFPLQTLRQVMPALCSSQAAA